MEYGRQGGHIPPQSLHRAEWVGIDASQPCPDNDGVQDMTLPLIHGQEPGRRGQGDPAANPRRDQPWRVSDQSEKLEGARNSDATATRKRAVSRRGIGSGLTVNSGPLSRARTVLSNQKKQGRPVVGRCMKKSTFIRSQALLQMSRWKPNQRGPARAAAYVEMVGAAPPPGMEQVRKEI